MSIKNDIIIAAVDKGYFVNDDGSVIGSRGQSLSPYINNRGYYSICIRRSNPRSTVNIGVHRLAAFQKFGEKIFEPGVQVRHLDGNALNNKIENIEIGTASDNQFDVPQETRLRRGQHAANYKRKFSDEEILEIRKLKDDGMSLNALVRQFGVSKSTMSYIVNRKTYNNV